MEIRSENSEDRVWAEVLGTLPFSFEVVAEVLEDPAAWCAFVALHINTKACVHGFEEEAPFLILYTGRKHYEAPEEAHRLDFRFRAELDPEDGLRVTLHAERGPLGTRDHRIEVEAGPGPGGTAVRVHCSYVESTISRVGTGLYLATLGRGKVGFTRVVGPGSGESEPVGGVRGIIERNAVRYYLALDAFLRTRDLPAEERFEARLRTWFDLAAQYPQLRELDWDTYVESKRRERLNQTALQSTTASQGPQVLPGAR